MKTKLFYLLVLTAILLAACTGVDPSLVICPKNPAALPPEKQVCRPNADENLNNNVEVRVPALSVASQQKAIYYGYTEDFKPVLIDQVGLHHYPADKSIVLPLQVQDFRNDSDPDGAFCAGQRPRCIGPIGGVTIEYLAQDGRVKTISDVTISVTGSLQFVVRDETTNLWLGLDRTRTQEDFWFKFWDQIRIPKVVSIVETGIDPIADQWGERTIQALNAVYTERLADWKLFPTFELTDGSIAIKDVEVPTIEGGNVNANNVDIVATQNAADLARAEAFATQKAVVCGDMSDLACAMIMQSYTGQGNAPQVVIQAPAPTPTATSQP